MEAAINNLMKVTLIPYYLTRKMNFTTTYLSSENEIGTTD